MHLSNRAGRQGTLEQTEETPKVPGWTRTGNVPIQRCHLESESQKFISVNTFKPPTDEPIEKRLKSTRSYSEDGANEIEVLGSVPSSGSTLKFIGSILGVKTTFFLCSAIYKSFSLFIRNVFDHLWKNVKSFQSVLHFQ